MAVQTIDQGCEDGSLQYIVRARKKTMIGPTSSGVVARSLAAGGPERAAACVLLRLFLLP